MNWLFPIEKRDFAGRRWLSISMRTLHLMGIAGLAGAYLFHLPETQWMPYLWMAVISGVVMACTEVFVDGIWLLQIRGQAIFVKLLLLSTVFWLFDEPQSGIYLLVILISGVISHAPGKVRYYSVWHGKVLTKADLINKNCGES